DLWGDPLLCLYLYLPRPVARRTLPEQPILAIDTVREARAAHVMLHDVAQYREQPLERIGVATRPDVPVERMEEPHRRVRGVVEPFRGVVREHVRDQAVTYVARERAQDVAGLATTAGRERQPLERDHRVAPPVREPVVTGDDRACLVACSVRTRELSR